MLQICDIFGASYNVTFNVSKYQLVHFSNNTDEKFNGIKHCSNFIQKSDFSCHLGNIIHLVLIQINWIMLSFINLSHVLMD